MRYFKVDVEPSSTELKAVNGSVIDGKALGAAGFYVAVEKIDGEKPAWLEAAEELNIPGEPHRCLNCGELI